MFKKDIALITVLLVIFLAEDCFSRSPLLSSRRRRCIKNHITYEEGDTFQHEFNDCIYNCTCSFKHDGTAYGNCSRRCPAYRIPPGCRPMKNKCGCVTSHTCPEGEKCQDEETGKLYKIGERWSNESCTCTCRGRKRGMYQCQCLKRYVPPVQHHPTDCLRDTQVQCFGCRSNSDPATSCPMKVRCDHWPYQYKLNGKTLNMTCTCFGPHGFTQCVSRQQHSRNKRSFGSFFPSAVLNIRESAIGTAADPCEWFPKWKLQLSAKGSYTF